MSDAADFAQRIELFTGRASDAVAYVYARLGDVVAGGEWTLRGSLFGPTCRYAETLPTRFALVDRGPGKSLLAEATLPEPCFWTPEMPHLYQAEIELRRGAETLATARHVFGLRRLGAQRHTLLYDGKRWVLRAVSREEVSRDQVAPTDLQPWREASTAMLVRNPPEELCDEASRAGVLLVAEVDSPSASEIRRLSRWPAVGMVVLPAAEAAGISQLATLGHNLLFAQRFAPHEPVRPVPAVHIALVEVGPIGELPNRLADCPAAMMAMRRAGPFPSVAAARGACDRLQRDLAGLADWAGYVV